MGLPDFSLRRPVTIFMIFIGVILLGFISWNRLPQELFPPITYPQLTVVTTYKDAAPEEIELLITKPLEETIGTVSGLKTISSISKEETSIITAEFNWGTNMDFAALGVREKIDLVKERLPRGSEEPVVVKYNPFNLPVMVLNITSEMPPAQLMQFTRKVIKNELEKTEGVAVVQLSGGREREILVEVDQGRLQAAGISVVSISDALNKANLNYPAGTVEESFYEYLIRTIGEFKAVKEISQIPIAVDERPLNLREENPPEQGIRPPKEKHTEKRVILLKDVARVKDTLQEQSSISRYNGKDTISLSVLKQAGANTIWVANNVRAVLKELEINMPKGVKVTITYDQSRFIRGSISGVSDAAIQGGFLAFIVLYLFLRRVVSSLIVTITIPISILAVFSMMYFSNISLNMISLGGLALGVGMLVDCSIVVIENIFRHRELGKTPKEASVFATEEVNGAIWGSTLTTVVVFLPMIFVVGVAGQLFKELAFTVTASLMVSLVVALTLIPILASKEDLNKKEFLWGKHFNKYTPYFVMNLFSFCKRLAGNITGAISNMRIAKNIKRPFSAEKVSKFYLESLKYFIKHRFFSLLIAVMLFLLSIFVLTKMDWELLPRVDQGQFIIKVNLVPGTRLSVTNSVVKKIEAQLFKLPEIKDATVSIGSSKEKSQASQNVETLGSHQAQIIVSLKPLSMYKTTKYTTLQSFLKGFSSTDPKKFRVRYTNDILQDLKRKLEKENLFGAEVEYILQESIFQAALASDAPVTIEIKGQDLAKMKNISESIQKQLAGIVGVYSVRSSLIKPAPEAKVYVRKDRAATYNLSVSDIALTAQTAMKGYVATKFKEGGNEIDVRVRLRPEDRSNMNKVRRLIVHSPLEMDVPLAEVTYMSIGKGPSQIQRLNQQRVIVISSNIYKRALKDVMQEVNNILDKSKVNMPQDYSVKLTGENQQMKESFNSLRFALILSLVLVYMVMAAEFESLWQPFVILFTFPLSLIGVVFALWITHTPLSIMVVLGIIILGGIVVDNSIVLIEYVNILRKRDNFSVYDALIDASFTRLRPIMMTALSTALGLLPLAIGLAEGAEIQIPMAVTVMGGLLFSTFLSLVVIPAIYLTFEDFIVWAKGFVRAPLSVFARNNVILSETCHPEPFAALKGKLREGSNTLDSSVASLPQNDINKVIHLPHRPEPKPPLPAINLPHEFLPEASLPEAEAPHPAPVKIEPQPEIQKPRERKLPEKYAPMELTRRQKEFIFYLLDNYQITRPQYIQKFEVSKATAARDLKELQDKGIIKALGPKAIGRYYELT